MQGNKIQSAKFISNNMLRSMGPLIHKRFRVSGGVGEKKVLFWTVSFACTVGATMGVELYMAYCSLPVSDHGKDKGKSIGQHCISAPIKSGKGGFDLWQDEGALLRSTFTLQCQYSSIVSC